MKPRAGRRLLASWPVPSWRPRPRSGRRTRCIGPLALTMTDQPGGAPRVDDCCVVESGGPRRWTGRAIRLRELLRRRSEAAAPALVVAWREA